MHVGAPYFVIHVSPTDVIASVPIDAPDKAIQLANSGFGFISYAVGTIGTFDRNAPEQRDLEVAALQLIFEMTSNRHSMHPNCIPVALYRKAELIALEAQKIKQNTGLDNL